MDAKNFLTRFNAAPRSSRLLTFVAIAVAALSALLTLAPVRPILVTTDSVPRGLYLVDARAGVRLQRGDFVAFAYVPPIWAADRHYAWTGRTFIKQAFGVPGDLVATDGKNVSVCAQDGGCMDAGSLRTHDSAGRPMPAFAGQSYRLGANEIYAGAMHNPKSFDSRYYGPVSLDRVIGVAHPIWTER